MSGTPVPDLATDTGTTPDNGKTWTFTLKDGIKWEDGKDITCEDFAYGLSRSFDDTLVNGTGPGTAYVSILDIPKVEDDGTVPTTRARSSRLRRSRRRHDKAVSCDGKTITYTFDQAWPDFPLSVAALSRDGPVPQGLGPGLQEPVEDLLQRSVQGRRQHLRQRHGRDVRPQRQLRRVDGRPRRCARQPGRVQDRAAPEPRGDLRPACRRLGDDQTAFATTNIPASFYSQIEGPVADRTLKMASPYTRFLQINNERVTDPKVRLAMVTALNREGGLKVLGGDNYGEPASTIVSASTPGYQANASFEAIPGAGDPDAAKQLLKDAGAAGYPLKVSYGQTDQNDKLFAVFKESWEAAGFKVTLNAIPEDANPGYYGQMSAKDKDTDVFYAGWASDWPSLLSVIPIVLETNNPGFNYGYYSNPDVDALIAKGREAAASGDNDGMISDLQQADALAGEDAAYVPFLQQKNYFIYGSKIGGFLPTVATSFYPDLGPIYVK